MAAVSSRAATRKLSARTAVQAASVGLSLGSHLQLRPASRARLPLRLPPDVNVRVATETVGGRKIAHNSYCFRTPCCAPTVRFNSRRRAAPLNAPGRIPATNRAAWYPTAHSCATSDTNESVNPEIELRNAAINQLGNQSATTKQQKLASRSGNRQARTHAISGIKHDLQWIGSARAPSA